MNSSKIIEYDESFAGLLEIPLYATALSVDREMLTKINDHINTFVLSLVKAVCAHRCAVHKVNGIHYDSAIITNYTATNKTAIAIIYLDTNEKTIADRRSLSSCINSIRVELSKYIKKIDTEAEKTLKRLAYRSDGGVNNFSKNKSSHAATGGYGSSYKVTSYTPKITHVYD